MIEIRQIHAPDSKEYGFMEKLLTNSFPLYEYRELSELKSMTSSCAIFHNNLLYDDKQPVGFITYWNLNSFYFFEHFATLPEMRNKGYGKMVLTKLQAELRAPMVLEVEYPEEETQQRRIRFYERQGFELWQDDYKQPPYRAGDEWRKMFLMAWGGLDAAREFGAVKKAIYKNVYKCEA